MQKPLLILPILWAAGLAALIPLPCAAEPGLPEHFTRLDRLPGPKIVASAEAYPGGAHNVGNILEGKFRREYSSNGKGTDTFIEFDFGAPTAVAAFRHVDRNDPATIAASQLTFLDESGAVVGTVPVKHVNTRAGVTCLVFPSPVTARRVRWQVTELDTDLRTVGGAEIAFYIAGKTEPLPTATTLEAKAPQILERRAGASVQMVKVTVRYPYAEPVRGIVRLPGAEGEAVNLQFGSQTVELPVPAVTAEKAVKVEIEAGGRTVTSREVTLKPVRKLEIYLLPHSHNDIGYTALQADVEKKQNSNLEDCAAVGEGHRGLSRGRPLQMEYGSALERGELPPRRHAGTTGGLPRRR